MAASLEHWDAGSIPGPAQWEAVLLQLWKRSKLQLGSDPSPGNSICHGVAKNEKKERKKILKKKKQKKKNKKKNPTKKKKKSHVSGLTENQVEKGKILLCLIAKTVRRPSLPFYASDFAAQ